jgi:hypothetical protein
MVSLIDDEDHRSSPFPSEGIIFGQPRYTAL